MKILTKKKQEKIYKLVSACLFLTRYAVEGEKDNKKYENALIDELIEISYEVGGIKGITGTREIVQAAICKMKNEEEENAGTENIQM